MTIDTDWQFKAVHWENEAKRLIQENQDLKSMALVAEAEIDRLNVAFERAYEGALKDAASVAYRVCAETRHVTLGDKAAEAIRALSKATA